MPPASVLSSQARAVVLAIKRALRRLHEGGIPRKAVFLDPRVAVSEGQYAKWLDDAYPYIPDIPQLLAICNITGDMGPLNAVVGLAGEGHRLAPLEGGDSLSAQDGLHLLESTEVVDSQVHRALAHDLANDGEIDAEEARKQLPAARERGRQAQDLLLRLERTALGSQPLPLRRAE